MQYCGKRTFSLLWQILLLMAGGMLLFGTAYAEAADFGERIGSMAEIKAVRISNTSDKTRIVIDSSREAAYKVSVLSNPQRIVVDIKNAWVNSSVKKSMAVGSSFAQNVRIAQHDANTVRVVVESSLGKNNYKIFPLKGGSAAYRIVMDFGDLGNASKGSGIDFNAQPKSDEAAADAAGQTETAKQDDVKISEPVFTPGLKGKIIALDAGHGGSDVGAIGPTGVTEKGVSLRVAQELQKRLLAEGAVVLMTRTKDTEVSPKKANASDVEELQARCDVGNNGKADIFLSIHMDSFTNSTPSGTTGYYYAKGSRAGQRLAQYVSEGIVASLGTGNRGTKSCNFYVVKHTAMPAALLEMAFISNDKEEKLMNSEAGIKKAAEGILNGLKKFFG
ncbi:MAG: N-acetylmuramoyl-L-alanine amidase [Anaerovibrio sp.]|nr:N-acetylmuramoyl-L-alanine amidase [Anaerovibrio sp.]